MTMRRLRCLPVRESWLHYYWRLLVEAVALIVAWLVAVSAAGQQPANPLGQFDPDKFFQQLFGAAGGDLQNEARLAKVQVTWQEEQQLGQQSYEQLKQQLAATNESLVERGRDVEYVQKLAALIQPQMQQAQRYRQLKIAVASLKMPEACCFPGGRVLVTRGMLEACGSEAALVGVLGHELSHLDRGHLLVRMKQWKLAQRQFTQPAAGFTPDKLLSSLGTMTQLFRRPFGPGEELDADTDGITWTYRAGYDPRALTDVYAAFQNAGFDQPEFLPAFLRTHPPSAERRANLTATFEQLQAAAPQARLYLGRENLARRLTRKQREFAE